MTKPAPGEHNQTTALAISSSSPHRPMGLEAATASWKGFRDDPNWVKVRDASEVNGKLTTEVKSVYLVPLSLSGSE